MQTVLYVSPMALGDEVQVRAIHERFPVAALNRGAGVERLAAFIGSGFYALEITVADGDFQEQFHRFLATPEVAGFFQELAAHVDRLPLNREGTAEMPLATRMLDWRRDGS
ncbi:MAG: hypothetical protein H0V24_06580 [Chloroflexia bacterium]|nr:hypothetical protein [Chloroflexia bacterium]MDQ3410546.1 hypothetical protein [Chloroflexota bacterium]